MKIPIWSLRRKIFNNKLNCPTFRWFSAPLRLIISWFSDVKCAETSESLWLCLIQRNSWDLNQHAQVSKNSLKAIFSKEWSEKPRIISWRLIRSNKWLSAQARFIMISPICVKNKVAEIWLLLDLNRSHLSLSPIYSKKSENIPMRSSSGAKRNIRITELGTLHKNASAIFWSIWKMKVLSKTRI